MPNLLGRIEREYILSILRASLPAISIEYDGKKITIDSGAYRISENCLFISGLSKVDQNVASIRVLFTHGQSLFSFNASKNDSGSRQDPENYVPDGVFSRFTISSSFFRNDCEMDWTSLSSIAFVSGGALAAFLESTDYPLDRAMYVQSSSEGKETIISRICKRAGLPDTGIPQLANRLFKYLDDVKHQRNQKTPENTLLFIDHRFIVVSASVCDTFPAGDTWTARYTWNKTGQRRIVAVSVDKL